MKARIAYLTSPAPNRFVLHFQPEDDQSLLHIEISKGHLANILITGTSLALQDQYPNRVPELQPVSADNGTSHHRT